MTMSGPVALAWENRWVIDGPRIGVARRGTLGIGWRPEVAGVAAARSDVGFVEVVAESLPGAGHPLPFGLSVLLERNVDVVVHGIGLSLGGADRPDAGRVAVLADAAARFGSPVVSEHLAFVRAGGRSAGHLLPVPRTWAMVDVLVENIRIAQDQLPVPLAVEPAASLVDWPGAELDEADFVAEVVERSGAGLLVDLANLFVNARNTGNDPFVVLDRLPLERVAYAHVAGGRFDGRYYHDTHAAAVWPEVIALTRELVARLPDAKVMLERDDRFGTDADLGAELDELAGALDPGGSTTWPRPAAPSHRRVRPRPNSVLDPSAEAERRRIGAEQDAFLGALVDDLDAPPGFDVERVAVTRQSLLAKRTREVAARWPATAAWLGDDLVPRFAAYGERFPAPLNGGPTADGAAFIATLGRRAGDEPARAEWRRAGLRTPGSWRRRW